MSVISAYGGNDNEYNAKYIYINPIKYKAINKLNNEINLNDDNSSRRFNVLFYVQIRL